MGKEILAYGMTNWLGAERPSISGDIRLASTVLVDGRDLNLMSGSVSLSHSMS